MAVMDANPRTKRIKDLQEQIHAWESSASKMGRGHEQERVGEKDAEGKRRGKRTRSPMDSNEDKYL